MSMDDYYKALHAMQTGVAVEMELDNHSVLPKHLRVGINSAMCDNAALTKLLIAKGIITSEEHIEAITKEMQEEVKRYEARLLERTGKVIHLA